MQRSLPPVLLVFLLVACATSSVRVDAPREPQPLVALSNFLHPPFSSRDPHGRAVGIEIDLLGEAARRLGRTVTWSEHPFAKLVGAVAAGEADVAAATIGVTAERARQVAFSESYFTTTIVALTRAGAEEPRTLEALARRRIATQAGTTAVGAAKRSLPQCSRVLSRDEDASWAEMLADGRVDAVVLDRSHAAKFMADAGHEFHVVAEPLREEHFAFALHPDDHALRAMLDQVIREHSTATR